MTCHSSKIKWRLEGDVTTFSLILRTVSSVEVPNVFILDKWKGVIMPFEALQEVIGQVRASEVDNLNFMGEGKAFVDRNGMSDAVTNLENDAGGATRSIQGQVEKQCKDRHGKVSTICWTSSLD